MKLTDDFVKGVPPADSKAGRKYSDGNAMYLCVRGNSKMWRLDYRFADKRKTLALGVYPAVSLEEARSKANSARELLNGGVDPGESRKVTKQVQREAAQGLRPRHPGAVLRDGVLFVGRHTSDPHFLGCDGREILNFLRVGSCHPKPGSTALRWDRRLQKKVK